MIKNRKHESGNIVSNETTRRLAGIILSVMLSFTMLPGYAFAESEAAEPNNSGEAVLQTDAQADGSDVQSNEADALDAQESAGSNVEKSGKNAKAAKADDTEKADAKDTAAETEQPETAEEPESAETDEPEEPKEIIKKGKVFKWNGTSVKFSSNVVVSDPLDAEAGPVQAAIKGGKTSMTVSWDIPKAMQNGVTTPDGFVILRKAGKEKNYSQIATVESGVTTYTDKKAKKKNTSYYYVVAAYKTSDDGLCISPCSRWAAGQTSNSKLKNAYSAKQSHTSAKMQSGEKLTLKLTIENSKKCFKGSNVRWFSGNEDAATVDSKGNVVGVNAGTAVITGVLASGKEYKTKVTVVGASKPAAVTIEAPCATTSSITIEWKKSDKATGYDVYCSTDGGKKYQLIGYTEEPSYIHEDLTAKKSYMYYVIARNDNRGETALSDKSNIVTQKAVKKDRPFSIPVASAKLKYGSKDNGVVISWKMEITNGVDHYEIFRGTSDKISEMKSVGKAGVKEKSFSMIEHAAGTYYYAVKAVDAGGKGKMSEKAAKVTVKSDCILETKALTWTGTTGKKATLYSTAAGSKKVGSVAKGAKVTCIGKYPEDVPKFGQPSWVKVQTSNGTVGWLKYSQLKGGVKAKINIKKDYTRSVKEDYVNSMGYTSKTKYLTWLSTYTQRVYTFKGSKGKWELVRTDRVTTGRFSHPTPGIDEAHRSSNRGQIYKREPLVYMVTESGRQYYYRNASYYAPGVAFHTGTWWLDTGARRGTVENKPGTFGCIRMYEEGAGFIYTLPMHTSVIVTNKA
ncbi:MAG: fibronectin type III domain-containing protein [Mogibacterium sp.]|nr:fibronectin type III domain-containing protein [Mogibacterium sp.]